jgi:nicotinate-nucleotide pyrophosphorylase (carboxylating)
VRFVEAEADSLEQARAFMALGPGVVDIVLLDNMPPALLAQAVAHRDAHAPGVLLEASGGVTLETIGAIAATRVDRISVGAITHGARAVDIGLDAE